MPEEEIEPKENMLDDDGYDADDEHESIDGADVDDPGEVIDVESISDDDEPRMYDVVHEEELEDEDMGEVIVDEWECPLQ